LQPQSFYLAPPTIKKFQSIFYKAVKEQLGDKIVMVRPDAASLWLVGFGKSEGDSSWVRCSESYPILRGIMLPDYVIPKSITLPCGGQGCRAGTGTGTVFRIRFRFRVQENEANNSKK
jgi:hypothetical protein